MIAKNLRPAQGAKQKNDFARAEKTANFLPPS
jgi:hypothetical protein